MLSEAQKTVLAPMQATKANDEWKNDKAAANDHVQALSNWLNSQPVGSILDQYMLEHLLGEAWDELDGSQDYNTKYWKLYGRVEQQTWNSPILTFVLERHGATVMGSSRAYLHRWTVDLQKKSATCDPYFRRRQLYPMAKRFDAKKPAQEVAEAILGGADDARILWKEDKKLVEVLISRFVGGSNSQTVSSRRQRFRSALEPLLASGGWVPAVGRKANTYTKKDGTGMRSHPETDLVSC